MGGGVKNKKKMKNLRRKFKNVTISKNSTQKVANLFTKKIEAEPKNARKIIKIASGLGIDDLVKVTLTDKEFKRIFDNLQTETAEGSPDNCYLIYESRVYVINLYFKNGELTIEGEDTQKRIAGEYYALNFTDWQFDELSEMMYEKAKGIAKDWSDKESTERFLDYNFYN